MRRLTADRDTTLATESLQALAEAVLSLSGREQRSGDVVTSPIQRIVRHPAVPDIPRLWVLQRMIVETELLGQHVHEVDVARYSA